ncbi:MAG: tRNA (adenosine(37)-N6)-threonylcarbamoyltransferase complex ATPase subunit type 1 TsaE [Candidatus Omnitrophica bacterium]|nr:tRNA (adenosine(37)-N6)-threonylcarbamoyltransferase complex ATPase subunit type 1 TsaE [Candidatus Omnitrophota bacterium]
MKIVSNSVVNTLNIGKKIAKILKPSDIICLFGDLGAGKTVLTKGIAKGLGISQEKVISPTFVLMRMHMGKSLPLYHFDLYRLSEVGDILGLGYEEYFYGQGIAIIEWADRLNFLMPKEFLKIELSLLGGTKRTIKFSAFGNRYKELLKDIHENISS